MGEIDFYPELCEKFKKYISSYLPEGTKVESSYSKPLPEMVHEIEDKMGGISSVSKTYMPSLKLDILFGFKIRQSEIRYVLIEVKYSNNLSLVDFSQLLGYLQVAKNIKIGILLLVARKGGKNALSNDFAKIVDMKELPMEWALLLKEAEGEKKYDFRVGICYYVPSNGLDWFDTKRLKGIDGFETLATAISP